MEKWKVIQNYSLYEVSDLGRVKNSGSSKILSQRIGRDGYVRVQLYNDDHKQHQVFVHRLVALAFIDNPCGLKEVNHKDENKKNNCAANLEWCDRLYNCQYGTRGYKISESQKVPIVQLTKNGDYIRTFPSIKDAMDELGITSHIEAVCKHQPSRKTAGGFKWEYLKNYHNGGQLYQL